ncbi:MAG: trigger factor [Anaerolineae bacterium]|nr:trigger factor [Anaerolineae bacterium]
MKVTTEQTEERVANLTIEVDEETMRPALQKAAREASRRLQIPGFRKGKAPYDVVVRLVGEEYLTQEALEELAPDLVARAMEEQEIEPYGRPQLTDMQINPPRVSVAIPLEPQVELGDYRSIHLEREPVEISDEDIDRAIEELRKARARLEPIERPLQIGDIITGRLQVQVEDGPTEENEDFQAQVSTPEEESLPGLSEHLVGAVVGDVVEFDTVFPVDYREAAVAGKKAHVVVELNETQVEVLPEVNDEFAVIVGDYDDLESLRRELRQKLEAEATRKAEESLRQRAVEALTEAASIRYPQAAVEDELDRMMEAFEQNLRSRRISPDAWYRAAGRSREEQRLSMRQAAERNVREGLALRQFIREEGIQATEEELTARVERAVRDLAQGDPALETILRSPAYRLRLANSLVFNRAMRRLISIVTGEPEPPEEALPLEEMPAPPVQVIEASEGEEEETPMPEEG